MKRMISSFLVFIMLFSLFTPIIEATSIENELFEEYSNDFYESIMTSENVIALIPDNSDSLIFDIGSEGCLIADIKPFSTYSLRRTNEVAIAVSQSEGYLDVLHFVEDSNMISEDMAIMDISNYSDSSKDILQSAINAYQEKYDSTEDCVAVEVFNDLEVVDGVISFEVDSFSIFAIGDFNINTYEFYVDGTLYNKQILVGDSGILLQPETPYKDKSEFMGWQIDDSSEYQEFGLLSVSSGTDKVIKCNAVFNEVTYVYFYYEAKENADILETLSGKSGDIIYTEHIDYPLNLDKHVVSWHTDIDCTSPDVTEVVLGTDNIVLYPKVEKGHWVTFYTEGGSYIDPMFYAKDETIIQPADPIREGYSFIGWVDENGDTFEFNNQVVEESVRLTAKYEAQNVNYTVQIVLQNPNKPDKYDPIVGGIFTLSGLCGSTVNATDISMDTINSVINGLGSTNYFKKNLKYFYYSDTSNAAESVELESDSSSVLYIYYDRYMTELNYYFDYSDTEPWKVQTGLYDADMPSTYWLIPTESEYHSFGNWESQPGLYPAWTGQFNYTFIFDSEREIYYFNVYATEGAENKFYFHSYVQAINPDGTVPDVGVEITDTPYRPHLDYYNPNYPGNEGNQVLIDNWSNIDFGSASRSELTNNDTWILYESQDLPFMSNMSYLTMFYDSEWYKGFTAVAVGFDLYHKETGSLDTWAVDDYASREWQSYITYLNPGRVETGPVEGSSYTETDGKKFYYLESNKWYALDTPFKIPKFYGNGYFRFIRNQFNLQFVMDDQTVADYDVYFETDLGLDKFTSVSEGLTAPMGYVFGGWFTSPTLTEDTRFNLETNIMPANDLILYGKWSPIHVELDVHVTIDGTDEIIEGFNAFTVKYGNIVEKERVDALKGSVDIPAEAIWYGWYEKINVGGGKELLVPFNFDKQLIEDIVLYPFYSYITPVKVIYNLNGGSGIAPTDNYNYALGRGAVVLDNKNIIPPDGKVFICWNTKADGSGKSYYPADIALINEDNMNLYAIYEDVSAIENVGITYINTLTNEEEYFEYGKIEQVTIKDKTIFSNVVSPKYIFKNWNTESDGSGVSYEVNDLVYLTDSDNKLYTIWEVDPNYDVRVIYINPLTNEEITEEYSRFDTVTLKDKSIFTQSVHEKYLFIGWNTELDGTGTSYSVNDTTVFAGENKLYAMWEIDPNYKLVINYIDFVFNSRVTYEYEGENSAVIKDISNSNPKYVFKEWNTKQDGTGQSYNPNDTLTYIGEVDLYAIWEIASTYELIINYVNTITSEIKEFIYSGVDSITLKDKSVFDTLTHIKYIFSGWNTKSDGTGIAYNPNDIIKDTDMQNQEITLYGIWELDPDYKLVINYINTETLEEKEFEYLGENSATIKDKTVFSNSTHEKYIFKGWNTKADGSGTTYQPNDTITQLGEVDLYTVWELDPDYKLEIIYIDELNSEEVEFVYVGENSAVIKDKDIFSNENERYTFKGWSTEPNGLGTVYQPNDTITQLGEVTLYAIWEEKIVITYVNTLTNEEVIEKYVSSDTIIVKDTAIFTNPVDSKYEFKGWNTASDGSGTNYNVNDTLVDTVTLYAVYKEKVTSSRPSNPSPIKYTYTIYYKDSEGNTLSEKVVGKGEIGEVIKAKAKDINGYVCKDAEKSLKITRNSEDNIITFVYEKKVENTFKLPEHKYLDYSTNHKHYIVGYEDGTVRPENNITRAESATIFYRLLKDSVQKEYTAYDNKFNDVNDSHWFNISVSTLTSMGIIGGYSDNTFRPNQYITRAEFVSLMVAFFEAEDIEYQNIFSDISESDWYYKSVLIGVNKGFIAGYPNGSFKPNQYITRAEACKIVNSVLCRKPIEPGLYDNLINWPDLEKSAWYYLDVMEATHSHGADYTHYEEEGEYWDK